MSQGSRRYCTLYRDIFDDIVIFVVVIALQPSKLEECINSKCVWQLLRMRIAFHPRPRGVYLALGDATSSCKVSRSSFVSGSVWIRPVLCFQEEQRRNQRQRREP